MMNRFQTLLSNSTCDATPRGESALFVAAKRGACGAIAALIRMGAAVHAEPAPGKTALFAAVENDQVGRRCRLPIRNTR